METLDRPALMRKTMPELRHVIRRLGADSPQTETRESLVSRILLFQPQKFKEQPKIKHDPVVPLTEEWLRELLKPYLLRGMTLDVRDGCWFIAIRDRKDSGSLAMPASVVERTAKYLMPMDL